MQTVSNRLLHDWLRVSKAHGCDLPALLKASGIPWRHYEDHRADISVEQLARLNLKVRCRLNDQFMGYGQEVMSPALMDRVLIKILAQTRTLREIVNEWQTFWNLVQNRTGRVSTLLTSEELIYRFQFTSPQRPGTYVWILDSTMLKLQLFSWMIGKQIKPRIIGIAEPAPAGVSRDLSLLPADVLFGQTANFFSIRKEYLNCPVIRTPQECLEYQQHLPADFFAIPGEERCFAGQVSRIIRNSLEDDLRLPRIEGVAEELSVSVRGLRRRLEAENETFQSLKDRIRRDLALKKLACAGTPIHEIAADLGFSETAAFSRAFKHWTASTPQQFRHRQAGGGPPV